MASLYPGCLMRMHQRKIVCNLITEAFPQGSVFSCITGIVRPPPKVAKIDSLLLSYARAKVCVFG